MKYVLLISFVLFSTFVYSQKISGTVVDQNGNPIPFTTIGVPNKNIGTYAFEDGSFTLNVSGISGTDCIIFRHIGFIEKCINLSELGETIILESDAVQLADVVVKPGKRKRKGPRKGTESTKIKIRTPFNGAEMATMFDFGSDSVIVEQVTVSIIKQHITSPRVRVKFYEVNDEGIPGRLMQNNEIEGELQIKKGYAVLNVQKPFLLANKVFVSFEWLVKKEEAAQILNVDYKQIEPFLALQEQFPNDAIDIYNNEMLIVSTPGGKILDEVRLSQEEKTQLRRLENGVPKFFFNMSTGKRPTYYRSHSLGQWYKIDKALTASIVYLPY